MKEPRGESLANHADLESRADDGDIAGEALTEVLAGRLASRDRSIGRDRKLSDRPMGRRKVLEMIQRRAKAAGLSITSNCHTFRATGIADCMRNGGTIETAQQMARHESSRSSGL